MSKIVDLTELAAVPIPQVTETYQPIGHVELIESVKKIGDSHFEGEPESHISINGTGNQMFGTLTYVTHKYREHSLTLGFRNSYDKSLAVGLCAGQKVIVCSNLMFTGDIVTVRKHTSNVKEDLENLIVDLIMSSEEIQEEADWDIEKMKGKRIYNHSAADFLGQLYVNEEILTSTQLSIAKKEWFNSSQFPERNAWSLYNACTESLKTSHTSTILNRYTDLHTFSMNYFELN